MQLLLGIIFWIIVTPFIIKWFKSQPKLPEGFVSWEDEFQKDTVDWSSAKLFAYAGLPDEGDLMIKQRKKWAYKLARQRKFDELK